MTSNIPASFGDDSLGDTSLSNLIDCILTDLQAAKQPTSLRVPQRCSVSMTSLSRESLIPPPIIPGRCSKEDDDRCTSLCLVSSTVLSDTSSDGDFEGLVNEITRHPMVEAHPAHRLTRITSQSGSLTVNQKAAKVLGLDGAGCAFHPFDTFVSY